ncbi:MAG: PocR ligand-binding domain-containing protein [Eubacteriales bacterium]
MDSTTNIVKLLDLDKFQKLQDAIAEATSLAIITIDYKGVPITKHSNCSAFCKLARSNPLSSNYCQKCDSRGGLEAVRLNQPYFYECHYNLIDLAVPIIVDNKYIGAIMAGQVRLNNIPPSYQIEKIVSKSTCEAALKVVEGVEELYQDIPYIDYELFIGYTNMLSHMSNYIITEAIEKIRLHNSITSTAKLSVSLSQSSTMLTSNGSSSVIPSKVLTPQTPSTHSAEEIIKPLLQFIEEHPNNFPTSGEASVLCNVSPSYFSKSFKKVMSISYTQYITEIKLLWAKEFLVLSSHNIDSISEKLGFSNTSYFTKTFKKYENLSPSIYRKYYKQDS